MPKIPGINHQDAVRALQKAGFRIARQGKHVVLTEWVASSGMPDSLKMSFARRYPDATARWNSARSPSRSS